MQHLQMLVCQLYNLQGNYLRGNCKTYQLVISRGNFKDANSLSLIMFTHLVSFRNSERQMQAAQCNTAVI